MNSFAIFQTPQRILYGRGAFQQLGKEARGKTGKALIVTDNIMTQLGYVDQCCQLLAAEGIETIVYDGVLSEPTDQYVADALELLKSEGCTMVISLGGGSCIDTAKAIVILEENGGYIGDYMRGEKECRPGRCLHIAIPTTAGTGSEATDVTVITNVETGVKMMIKDPAFMPTIAIVDPLLTKSAPEHVTAATGVDALCHALEAYISKKAHPMTETLALSAIELIVQHLQRAFDDETDLDAKEAMSLGSLQAGMAFSNASVCLVHGMSRPIGALFHVPHGISNAMLLPAILEYSRSACTEKLAGLAYLFSSEYKEINHSVEAADFVIEQIKRLCHHLQIPNLKTWGIPHDAFNASLPKMAEDALASGSPGNNPKVPTKEEIINLYKICYEYDLVATV